jgi:hypothetical protein
MTVVGVVYLKCLLGDNGCGFFQVRLERAVAAVCMIVLGCQAEAEHGLASRRPNQSSGQGQGQSDTDMRCNCGQMAAVRTVRKEGANTGG